MCGRTRSGSGFASSSAALDLKRLAGGGAEVLGVEEGNGDEEEDVGPVDFRLLVFGADWVGAREVEAEGVEDAQPESRCELIKKEGTGRPHIGLERGYK